MYKKVGLRVATRLYLLYPPFFFLRRVTRFLEEKPPNVTARQFLFLPVSPFGQPFQDTNVANLRLLWLYNKGHTAMTDGVPKEHCINDQTQRHQHSNTAVTKQSEWKLLEPACTLSDNWQKYKLQ